MVMDSIASMGDTNVLCGGLFYLESGWDPGPYARLTSTLSPGDTPSPCFAFQMTILAGVLDACFGWRF